MSHAVSISFFLNLTEGLHGAEDANDDLSLGFCLFQRPYDDLEGQCYLQTLKNFLQILWIEAAWLAL
jgi:hypothetical protein